ncbi:natural killer cells antigen CD94-like [Malaclemys terrapin pileata]|uniref:natural killer cells antigen CD94-like n=1 Tax=Malaclemys terrapin pileata TaxID=2991368 RepID=UPI0023A8A3E9|nr:natural killer cells antigen CD94-like [Malaclemys terrapin pileata]
MKDKTICGTSRSSSRTPASYQRATKNAPEMSEQAVTYVDLKFQTPSKQQKKKRQKNTRDKDSSAPAPAWRLIAGILGIFCLALLIAVGVLAANVFQISRVPCRHQDNLSQHQEITQAENGNLPKVFNRKHKGWKFLCPENWFPHGEKCYHFSTESKPWLESQKACSSPGTRLLLIENKEELDFISPLATSHWIGLSREKTDRLWMWVNGTAFSTDWFAINKGYIDGNCALVTGGELSSSPCKDEKRYICEQLVLWPKPDISA